MTDEPIANLHVPDGPYSCHRRIEDLGGQLVRAHALVSDGSVVVLRGASVACVQAMPETRESPGLAARRDHVSFSVSATLVDDVTLDSMTEAARLVLGREVGWKAASRLWCDGQGRTLAEIASKDPEPLPEQFKLTVADQIPANLTGAVLEFLEAVDGDFAPPLSSLTATHGANAGHRGHPTVGTAPYLESIRDHRTVLLTQEGVVAGMLSWEERSWGVAYVSCVAVRPALRCQGLARSMYAALEGTTDCQTVRVRTRSDDWAHLRLLRARGYAETGRRDDARAYGADSVYLEKRLRGNDQDGKAS